MVKPTQICSWCDCQEDSTIMSRNLAINIVPEKSSKVSFLRKHIPYWA